MAEKPLSFKFYGWAGSLLGPADLRRLLAAVYGLQFRLTGARAPLLSSYRRVAGRAPSPAEEQAYLSRLAERYADFMTTLFTLDQTPPARRFDGVETPALKSIEALRRRGKGVILAAPHYGNIPIALASLAARGVPLTVMFLRGGQYRWCEDSFGFKVASLGESAVDFWKALKANEAVMVYADIDFFPEGRTADFFGAPIRPPHAVSRLALAAGSPVLPLYEVSEGGRHRVEADAPIEPEGEPEDIESALLRSMERYIRARPDHWLALRDVWDLEAGDRLNRRLLAQARFARVFDGRR